MRPQRIPRSLTRTPRRRPRRRCLPASRAPARITSARRGSSPTMRLPLGLAAGAPGGPSAPPAPAATGGTRARGRVVGGHAFGHGGQGRDGPGHARPAWRPAGNADRLQAGRRRPPAARPLGGGRPDRVRRAARSGAPTQRQAASTGAAGRRAPARSPSSRRRCRPPPARRRRAVGERFDAPPGTSAPPRARRRSPPRGTPRISAAGARKSAPLGARRSASVPTAAMAAPVATRDRRVFAQGSQRARRCPRAPGLPPAPMPRPSRVISARSSIALQRAGLRRPAPPAATWCWSRRRWSRAPSWAALVTGGGAPRRGRGASLARSAPRGGSRGSATNSPPRLEM